MENTQNSFTSLADAIAKKISEIEKPVLEKDFRSQRNAYFFELYGFYSRCWKLNTWRAYNVWLRANKLTNNLQNREKFKKATVVIDGVTRKLYYPIHDEKRFCSADLGFMKTEDLYYLISIAKDKENRKENFCKWLFWAIKPQ